MLVVLPSIPQNNDYCVVGLFAKGVQIDQVKPDEQRQVNLMSSTLQQQNLVTFIGVIALLKRAFCGSFLMDETKYAQ